MLTIKVNNFCTFFSLRRTKSPFPWHFKKLFLDLIRLQKLTEKAYLTFHTISGSESLTDPNKIYTFSMSGKVLFKIHIIQSVKMVYKS